MTQEEKDILYRNVIGEIAKMVKRELLKNMVSVKVRLTSGDESFFLSIMGRNIDDAIGMLYLLQSASLACAGGLFILIEMDERVKRQLRIFRASLSVEEEQKLYNLAEELGSVFCNADSLLEVVARLRARFPDNLRGC